MDNDWRTYLRDGQTGRFVGSIQLDVPRVARDCRYAGEMAAQAGHLCDDEMRGWIREHHEEQHSGPCSIFAEWESAEAARLQA